MIVDQANTGLSLMRGTIASVSLLKEFPKKQGWFHCFTGHIFHQETVMTPAPFTWDWLKRSLEVDFKHDIRS